MRQKFIEEAEMTRLTHEQKIKFLGQGEWLNEPDHFYFEYRGYDCEVLRIIQKEPYAKEEAYFGGHLCGYIRIPFTHPSYHKCYHDINIDCHGGLTFGEVSNGYWIGFDCGHLHDIIPSMLELRKKYASDYMIPIPDEYKDFAIFNPVYRNMDFCVEECKHIVDQLIEMAGVQNDG